MSDFLNKFSKNDYKEDHKEKPKVEDKPKTEPVVQTVSKQQVEVEHKAVEPTKPVEFVVKPKERASHQEPEEVHIDPSYRKNQRDRKSVV